MTVYPLVLRLGPLEISGFGLMLWVAFVVGALVIRRDLRLRGLAGDYAVEIFIASGLGGVLGAKLWHAALYRDLSILLSRGGMVWWGGLIGGVSLVLLNGWRRRVPYRFTLELVGPPAALGYCLGRIGCFLVGDDYGVPTGLPWAMRFPEGLPPSTAWNLHRDFGVALPPGTAPDEVLAVHPTQLYEAAAMLAAFWLLWRLRRIPHGTGWPFAAYLALAGVERFAVEFLRAKDDRLFGALTLAQVTALAVLAVGLFLMRRWRQPEDPPLPLDAAVLRSPRDPEADP